jgi:hypothetical protein
MACTGHAIAMGSFLLLSGDHLVGSPDHRVMANGVAIGLTMPRAALAIMHHRLTSATYQRAVALAAPFVGGGSRCRGYLDELLEADRVRVREEEVARNFTALDAGAYSASKLLARDEVLDGIRTAIDSEFRRAQYVSGAAGQATHARASRPSARCRGHGAERAWDLGLYHAPGGRTGGHVGAGRVRAVRGQGRAGPADVLRGVPAARPRAGHGAGDRRSLADVEGLALVFRRFCLQRPALAQVMFTRPFADFDPGPDEVAAGASVREVFIGRIQRCVDARLLGGDPTDIVQVLLALVQGLAVQEGGRWLGNSRGSVNRRWTLGGKTLLKGFAN